MKHWQMQAAKNKFSEVIEQALHSGPQIVTIKGMETVVVLSMEEYRKLTHSKNSLLEFFRNSPLYDVNLDLERDSETGRDVEF